MVHRGEAERTYASDWRDLSESELDDRILKLVEAGDRITAVELLRRLRGLSTTEARRFVDELLEPTRS